MEALIPMTRQPFVFTAIVVLAIGLTITVFLLRPTRVGSETPLTRPELSADSTAAEVGTAPEPSRGKLAGGETNERIPPSAITNSLCVRVLDQISRAPIRAAQIELMASSSLYSGESDEDGLCTVNLPAGHSTGDTTLSCRADGYFSYRDRLAPFSEDQREIQTIVLLEHKCRIVGRVILEGHSSSIRMGPAWTFFYARGAGTMQLVRHLDSGIDYLQDSDPTNAQLPAALVSSSEPGEAGVLSFSGSTFTLDTAHFGSIYTFFLSEGNSPVFSFSCAVNSREVDVGIINLPAIATVRITIADSGGQPVTKGITRVLCIPEQATARLGSRISEGLVIGGRARCEVLGTGRYIIDVPGWKLQGGAAVDVAVGTEAVDVRVIVEHQVDERTIRVINRDGEAISSAVIEFRNAAGNCTLCRRVSETGECKIPANVTDSLSAFVSAPGYSDFSVTRIDELPETVRLANMISQRLTLLMPAGQRLTGAVRLLSCNGEGQLLNASACDIGYCRDGTIEWSNEARSVARFVFVDGYVPVQVYDIDRGWISDSTVVLQDATSATFRIDEAPLDIAGKRLLYELRPALEIIWGGFAHSLRLKCIVPEANLEASTYRYGEVEEVTWPCMVGQSIRFSRLEEEQHGTLIRCISPQFSLTK